ncbi:MAG: VCBS repeat-containing protein, partial [Planctomycetota bacterium]
SVAPALVTDLDGNGEAELVGPVIEDGSRPGVGRVSWTPAGFGSLESLFRSQVVAPIVSAGDLNADGRSEIVIGEPEAGGSVEAWSATATGTYEGIPLPLTASGGAIEALVEDLDRDGRSDLALIDSAGALVAYRSLGMGGTIAFGSASSVATGALDRGLAALDVNGDGLLDLAFTDASGRLVIAQQQPSFTFSAPVTAFDPGPGNELGLLLGDDLDADGREDLALSWYQSSINRWRLEWIRNQGGTFGSAQTLFTGPRAPEDLAVGDVNQDGIQDVIFTPFQQGVVAWLDGLGGGAFGSPEQIATFGVHPNQVELADVDLDGDLDLIVGSLNEGVAIRRNAGAIPFQAGGVVLPSASSLLAVDVDSDADSDIVSVQDSNRAVVIRENLAASEVGSNFCGPAVPNSRGRSALMYASGDPNASGGSITLHAEDLPFDSVGIFIVSRTQGLNGSVPGSNGRLCLAGSIGRYVAPGQVLATGSTGTMTLPIDPASLPSPFGPVTGATGENWSFQAWYRDFDQSMPANRSNMTDGRAITLQ